MTLFYGKCIGGPFDGRKLAHGVPFERIAFRRDTTLRGTIPGMVSSKDEGIAFGAYVFHPLDQSWHWFNRYDEGPTTPARYAVWITTEPVTAQLAPVTCHD